MGPLYYKKSVNYFMLTDYAYKIFSLLGSRVIMFLIFCLFIRLAPSQILISISLFWLIWRANNIDRLCDNNLRLWFKYGWLPLLGLVYCGTHTAGYNVVSMQLIIALMIADFSANFSQGFFAARIKNRYVITFGVSAIVLVILLKLSFDLYNWWGLRQGNVMKATYTAPFEELNGFRVDKPTSEFFIELAKYKQTLKADDKLFAYPSIPIAYLLLNKVPPVRMPIQWFYVSARSQAKGILEELEASKPKVIFWLQPPAYVYSGHAELRRLPSLMSAVDEWLYAQISSGSYKVEKLIQFPVSKSWQADIEDLIKPVTLDTFFTRDVNCAEIAKLKGVTIKDLSVNCSPYEAIKLGSIRKVTFENNYQKELQMKDFGFSYQEDDSHNFLVLNRVQ
jgi:hypothetical protein